MPLFETIEPLDYKTHDVVAGVQWASAAFQANFAYSGSFFRNGIDTLTWEKPADGNRYVSAAGTLLIDTNVMQNIL